MKKFLIVTLLIFLSCGPSEEEIQSQIDEAVENALKTTTTSTTSTTSTTTTTLAPTTTTSTTTTSTTTTIPKYAETYIGVDDDGNYSGVLLRDFRINNQNVSRNNFFDPNLFYIDYVPGSFKLTEMGIGLIDADKNDYTCIFDITLFNTMENYQGNIGCDINWNNSKNPYINVANGPTGVYKVRIITFKAEFIDRFNDVRAIRTFYNLPRDEYSDATGSCSISFTNLICNKLGGQPREEVKVNFDFPSFNLTD